MVWKSAPCAKNLRCLQSRILQVFYEELGRPETLKQVQHMERHDPYFHNLMVGGRLEKLASHLLGQPVRPVNLQAAQLSSENQL